MTTHSPRQRIVESSLLLPTLAIGFALLHILPHPLEPISWLSLLPTTLFVYIVVEWNNRYQLLRIRSRMNSACLIALLIALPQLSAIGIWQAIGAALLLSYVLLFRLYSNSESPGGIFHAFFPIALSSLFYPPILLFYPTLLFATGKSLRALSLRNFGAALLALLAPYWLSLPFAFMLPSAALRFAHQWLAQWQNLVPHQFQQLLSRSPDDWAAIALFALLATISIPHFLHTANDDKIRTRQYYRFLLAQFPPAVLLIVFDLTHQAEAQFLLLFTLLPLLAHYLSLARGKIANVVFTLLLVIIAVYSVLSHLQLWKHLLTF